MSVTPPGTMKALSLKTRFAIAMSAGMMLLVALLTAIALHFAQRELLAVVSGQQLALVSRAADDLDEQLRLAMAALTATAAHVPLEALDSTARIRTLLAGRAALQTIFDEVTVASVDGIIVGDFPANDRRIGLDLASRSYFKQVLATGRPTISEPLISRLDGKPIVTFVAPIKRADGSIAAVLIGLLWLDKPNLIGRLATAKIGRSGYFEVVSTGTKPRFVVDSHPAHSHHEFAALDSPGLMAALDGGASGTSVGILKDGSQSLISHRRLSMTNWMMVAVLPAREAFGSIDVHRERSIEGGILAAVVLIPLVWLLARWLLAPLSTLRDEVDRLGGQPSESRRVGEGRNDEAGQLARAFNRLLERQETLETSRLASETAVRQSEARMASIADSLPMMVAFLDRDCRYRFVNLRYEEFFGRPRSEIIGRTLREIAGPEVTAAYQPYFDRAAAGETVAFDREATSRRNLHFKVKIIPQFDDGATLVGFQLTHQDVTDYKLEQQRLARLASRDRLTGLVNRAGFEAALDEAMHRSAASATRMGLFYLDLDHFKAINDAHGHSCGDALLRAFSARLSASVRATDIVARLGGDEFVVIAESLRSTGHARAVAEKILQAMRLTFHANGVKLSITTSIGIAAFGGVGDGSAAIDSIALIERADAALYDAKHAGRDRYALSAEWTQFVESAVESASP